MARLRSVTSEVDNGSETRTDDLLQFLNFCGTGQAHCVHVPDGLITTDQLIGQQPFLSGEPPFVGDKAVAVVAIDGFPLVNDRGFLWELAELPIEYRWSTRFIFLDQHEAVAMIKTKRGKWDQKIDSGFDKAMRRPSKHRDENAENMVEDGTAALTEVSSGSCAGGLYTSVVIVMNEDPEQAHEDAQRICEVVKRMGLSSARIEDRNATEAFLGSLPGHGAENVRLAQMNTKNLADLMPTSTTWCGAETAPCPMYPPSSPPLMHCVAQGRTPYRLNLHHQDLGNTVILGPPGAGKSVLLALLAAQLRRYPGMQIFAFDKGFSMFPLCSAIHAATEGRSGLHFTVAGQEGISFAPLQHLETHADVVWALDWVDALLRVNGLKSTPQQRNLIGQELKRLNRKSCSLTDLAASVQDREVQEVLQMYTSNGTAGHLLDDEKDGLRLSDFTVLEVEELMALHDKFVLPVLLYLFRRIERSLTGQPAAIILDEAWLMLRHPVFRDRLWEWLKTMRKKNCIVILATQSLADVSESGIFEQFKEAMGSKILLPNPNARSTEATALYKSLGLNERQIELVASLKPKKHYYHVTGDGQRQFELAVGPLALAFCGASRKEDLARIGQLVEQYGHQWPDVWLQERRPRVKVGPRSIAA